VTTLRPPTNTFRPQLERLESRDPAAALGPSAAEQFLLERINDLRSNPWAFDPRIKGVVVAQGVARNRLQVTAIKAALRGSGVRFNEPNSITGQVTGGFAPPQVTPLPSNILNGTPPFELVTPPTTQQVMENALVSLVAVQNGESPLLSRYTPANVRLRPHRLLGLEVLETLGGAQVGVVTLNPVDRNPYLTGSAFRDANGNGKYDIGEGLGGVTVQVRGGPAAATYEAGGYTIKLRRGGTYQVTASGGGLAAPITRTVRVADGRNARLNFIAP
jgi:hypothetical protein